MSKDGGASYRLLCGVSTEGVPQMGLTCSTGSIMGESRAGKGESGWLREERTGGRRTRRIAREEKGIVCTCRKPSGHLGVTLEFELEGHQWQDPDCGGRPTPVVKSSVMDDMSCEAGRIMWQCIPS